MGPVEKYLLRISLTVAIAPLAQRLQVAEPVMFVIGGLLVSLIPGFPVVQLDPDLGFLRVMPPLLCVQALFTPWREFKADLRPILLLAVGLVVFTATGGAWFVHWLMPTPPLGRRPSRPR